MTLTQSALHVLAPLLVVLVGASDNGAASHEVQVDESEFGATATDAATATESIRATPAVSLAVPPPSSPYTLAAHHEDDYWVQQAMSGKIKRRVLRMPPLSELKRQVPLRGTATNAKPERVWSFSTAQRHVRLVEGQRNTFCRQKKSHRGYSQNSNGHCSWWMVQEFIDISHLPPLHIVDFRAEVTRDRAVFPSSPDGAIVHHMDLFPCTSAIDDKLPPVTLVEPDTWGKPRHGAACDQILFAYDRDAFDGLALPPQVGLRIGRGTPYTRLLMQWHYVYPPCNGQPCAPFDAGVAFAHSKHKTASGRGIVHDRSGFVITATPDLRLHDGACLAIIDPRNVLDYGSSNFLYSFEGAAQDVDRALAHDLTTYGELTMFAAHLHMHEHGVAMWNTHLRHGKKVGEFGRFERYGGGKSGTVRSLGAGETWMSLDGRSDGEHGVKGRAPGRKAQRMTAIFSSNTKHKLRRGDSLRVNCVFDTMHGNLYSRRPTSPIRYGMSVGLEMCGSLLLYYPHDAARRFAESDLVARRIVNRRTCFKVSSTSNGDSTCLRGSSGHADFAQLAKWAGIQEGAAGHCGNGRDDDDDDAQRMHKPCDW